MRACQSRFTPLLFLLTGALPLFLAGNAHAQIFVDADAPAGGDGSSWGAAFNTIQEAVFAAVPGEQVWVAEGDYPEVDTNGGTSLDLIPGVQLYGGFSGVETLLAQRDIANNLTRIVGTKNSTGDNVAVASVVLGDTGAVLDGFTITGGRAASGAGMYNEGKAPIVRNCTFVDNRALLVPVLDGQGQPTGQETGGEGGAVTNFDDALATFENCVFSGNEAELSGGAIHIEVRSNGTFENCLIQDNRSRLGGAVYMRGSLPTFKSCIITGNTAQRLRVQDVAEVVVGGGIYNVGRMPAQSEDPLPGDPLLINCLIANNTALDGTGGGFYSGEGLGRIFNCTIADNSAASGGGILTFDGSQLSLINTIVRDNTGGAILDNPAFFFEGATPNPLPPAAQTTATYSDIEGGWPGDGNIDVPAAFANPAASDYRLTQDSALIDAGTNLSDAQFGGIVSDFESDPRGLNGSDEPRGDGSDYDIGYDEYDGSFIPNEGEGDGGTEGEGAPEGTVEGDVTADIVYVNANNSNAQLDGLTWASAVKTLELGYLVAQISGATEIWVARGTYAEDRTGFGGALEMQPGIAVYGGFTGVETQRTQRSPQANITIISGATANAGQPASAVVRAASGATLDGFTISGGRGTIGAGLYADAATTPINDFLVENCTFTNNAVNVSGGGFIALGAVDATLRNVVFTGNSGAVSGGGATVQGAQVRFDSCSFIGNSAPSGGGLFALDAQIEVVNCTFRGNSAQSGGGLSTLNTTGLVSETLFDDNDATSFGAGAFNNGRCPDYRACAFYDNASNASGGGMSNAGNPLGSLNERCEPVIVNCIFGNNRSAQFGGGLFNNGAKATVSNSTFHGNTAVTNGAGVAENNSSGVYTNCIIWANNGPRGAITVGGSTTFNFCNMQDGASGTNISVNPRLASPATRDFHLLANSGCIDAGTDTSSVALGNVQVDFESDTRPFGAAYDIGADEFTGDITPEGEGGVEEGEGATEGSTEGSTEGVTEGEGALEGEPSAGVVYVNRAATGTEDGQSWATAFRTLQAGINAATSAGAEVWVARGVYAEARSNGGSLLLADGIALYGGFDGTETQRSQRSVSANPTVIDGATANAGSPAAHVVIAADAARLDGFTLRGGNGDNGAALLNDGTQITIARCTFVGNVATANGGALYNVNGAIATIENASFRQNAAGGDGGAVYNGPASSLFITQSLFLDNDAENEGGAIYNAGGSAARITFARFRENTVNNRGGAISNHDGATVLIGGCLIAGNTAAVHGGGINNTNASPTLVSTTVSSNTATFRGAGIYNNANGGPSQPAASGLIVWANNGENVGNNGTARLLANFSNIQGGVIGGVGNINRDPLFVDPATNNYKLGTGSPCIDTGQNTNTPALGNIVTDFELDARGYDGDSLGRPVGVGDSSDYDMGYDEFTGSGNTGQDPEGEFEGEGAAEGEGTTEGEGASEGAPEGQPEGSDDFGDVVFVDIDNVSGIQDGRTWNTAVTDLRNGIELARVEGVSEVWVAEGVYDELRTNSGTLLLRPGIALYGGFNGTETRRTQRNIALNETVIDGSRANAGSPAERVLEGADNARLDGFTIRGGRGFSGAGMLNFNASPVIANCTFTDNESTDFGGAMFNLGGSAPLITNCIFDANTAGESGGAVTSLESSPIIVGCVFTENTSRFGGAIFNNTANGEILGCRFTGNTATGSAGALAVLQSSPAIIGCNFSDNTALGNGGAVFINIGSARIEDCRFTNNASNDSGGGVYTLGPGDELPGQTTPFIVNSIFDGNRSAGFGAALFNNNSSPVVVNCTIFDNLSTEAGGAMGNFQSRPVVANTILWSNGLSGIRDIESETVITYSIVEGGYPGTGNLDVDPFFAGAARGDFRLQPGSPAIDAGRNAAGSTLGNVTDDIVGAPRGIDGVTITRGDGSDYDIGAYEFGDAAPPEGEGSADGEGSLDGEGTIEGSGEGEDCLVTSVSITAPRDEAIILVGNGVKTLPLGLSASTDCVADTEFVQYLIDEQPVGGSDLPPYGFTVEDITVLAAGVHTATAVAYGSTGQVEDSATFSLLAAPAGADANGNGYPDQATTVLTEDGDIWSSNVKEPTTGGERVTRVDRFERRNDNGGVPVVSVLSHPANPGVLITIEVDRRVIDPGDIGLLVVGIAEDLATLLGSEAGQLSPIPDGGIVPGAPYVAAGILVSVDGGVSFVKLDPARLEQYNVRVTFEGLQFSPEGTGLSIHPVDLRSTGSEGLRIEGVYDGGWTDDGVQNIGIEPNRLEADLNQLNLFAPFGIRPGTSGILVTPAQFTFGRVQVGQTAQTQFTITNTGSARLVGRATVAAPFRVLSGASYALDPGRSHVVTLSFAPTEARDYSELVNFSGGEGATRRVTGTGVAPEKANSFLGCAPGAPSFDGNAADLLLVLVLFAALLVAHRRIA